MEGGAHRRTHGGCQHERAGSHGVDEQQGPTDRCFVPRERPSGITEQILHFAIVLYWDEMGSQCSQHNT